MKNIGLIVEYDGSNFYGFQKQDKLRTVEGELEKSLQKATKEKVEIIAAGRTDKGVHSLGQMINFHTNAVNIPAENYKMLMDFLLPDDITIKDSFQLPYNFHSRFDAKKRRYKYLVYNRYLPNALYRKYAYHWPYEVQLNEMILASKYLIGEKDFTSFTVSNKEEKVNPVRYIEKIDINKRGYLIEFNILGNAFLHNMVRIIVGTLLYVGVGKIKARDMETILKKRDRRYAGITAGAEGLYLMEVFY